jgi:hypothetical protein
MGSSNGCLLVGLLLMALAPLPSLNGFQAHVTVMMSKYQHSSVKNRDISNMLPIGGSFSSSFESSKGALLNVAPPSADEEGDIIWMDLTPKTDGGVRKTILLAVKAPAEHNEPYPEGSTVTISYSGKVASANWSTDEVISCWLSEQQGLGDDDQIATLFRDNQIDEQKLTNVESYFTEAFVQDTLGITGKIACKKLVMAAKRLKTTRTEYPAGTEFDSNESYEIGPDSKIIQGMRLAVSSMAAGEAALVQVRSDYGYRAEGYRKRTGEVVVPPFASLDFEIRLE